ncbi:MAG: hypothetical protein KBD78_06335 [Oligoflexales bacterium]|nr:hypothetical protein [Oligoflexales bacterium]
MFCYLNINERIERDGHCNIVTQACTSGKLEDAVYTPCPVNNSEEEEEEEEENETNPPPPVDTALRPCDGQNVDQCIFQAQGFINHPNLRAEIVIANNRFYIWTTSKEGLTETKQFLQDNGRTAVFVAQTSLGHGKLINEIPRFKETFCKTKALGNSCTIDNITYENTDLGILESVIVGSEFYGFYHKNYRIENGEWVLEGADSLRSSFLGALYSVSDRYKIACDKTTELVGGDFKSNEKCRLDDRSSFQISATTKIDSFSLDGRYYNRIYTKEVGWGPWTGAEEGAIGSVEKYMQKNGGPCANFVDAAPTAKCIFSTRNSFQTDPINYNALREVLTMGSRIYFREPPLNGFVNKAIKEIKRYKSFD